jgi:hypothetical protein
MKNLFHAGKFLLLDMASTLFFLALYLWTDSIPLSVASASRWVSLRSAGSSPAKSRLRLWNG